MSTFLLMAEADNTQHHKTASSDDLLAFVPEFGRWRDVQHLFGIKRGTLYRLIKEKRIRSLTLREDGQKYGCRLVHLGSVRDYLNALLENQNRES